MRKSELIAALGSSKTTRLPPAPIPAQSSGPKPSSDASGDESGSSDKAEPQAVPIADDQHRPTTASRTSRAVSSNTEQSRTTAATATVSRTVTVATVNTTVTAGDRQAAEP